MEIKDRAALEDLIGRLTTISRDLSEMADSMVSASMVLQKLVDGSDALAEFKTALTEARDFAGQAEKILGKLKVGGS